MSFAIMTTIKTITKKIIVIFISIFTIINICSMPVNAASGSDFSGYQSVEAERFGGVVASILRMNRIFITDEQVMEYMDHDASSQVWINLLRKVGIEGSIGSAEAYNNFISLVYNNTELQTSEDGVKYYVLNLPEVALSQLNSFFVDLLTLFGGDDALNGDPWEGLPDLGYYLVVDGEYVCPWVSTATTVGTANTIQRGGFIPPSDYEHLFTLVPFTKSFDLYKLDGTLGTTISSEYQYNSYASTGSTTRYIKYGPSQYYYLYYVSPNTNVLGAWAFYYYPNINAANGGSLSMFQYAYVDEGVKPSAWTGTSRWDSLRTITHASDYVGTINPTVSCPDGITFIDTYNDNRIYIHSSNITDDRDIINNYLSNSLTPSTNPNPPSDFVNPFSDWHFPHLSSDGEGGFNFDFNLPDLNIDWKIEGLKDKFPFSIPWDLYSFYSILNVEPETPRLPEGSSIQILSYTWDLSVYDLSAFGDIAALLRRLEFVLFVCGLIIATPKMIK